MKNKNTGKEKKWPRNSEQKEMFIWTLSVRDIDKSLWEEGQISKMSWECGKEGAYDQDIEALACKKSGSFMPGHHMQSPTMHRAGLPHHGTLCSVRE